MSKVVDEAEVRKTQDLCLELVLSARDLDAERVAQILLQGAAIDARTG